jgi:hypothetical protein
VKAGEDVLLFSPFSFSFSSWWVCLGGVTKVGEGFSDDPLVLLFEKEGEDEEEEEEATACCLCWWR